ncbi:MAG: ATPase, T2SS/T4P/T4SS family [Alcanivoracaceae bacterium]|jgi:type IV pilus assembly protein PilB|nr:ATPase, T2SS/T4P/T4SS family [Alcanivoracaceae bacterium]
MPANTDLRTIQMVHAVPRSAFVSSADVGELMSGHSIPSQAAVRSILSRIPPLQASDKVLLIGAGSGYFAMILSRLVAQLVVVEHSQVIADIARKNLTAFKPVNVAIRVADGVSGAPDQAPFDRIIALCRLSDINALLDQLTVDGSLVVLEGADGRWTSLELCQRDARGNVRRQDLGPVDFSSDVSSALMDMGLVDDKLMSAAKEEAARLNLPLMTVIQRHLGAEDMSVYRVLAKRMGIRFEEAEKLFPQIDRGLVSQFSRTFLDHYRMIPIAQKGDFLQVASDNPEMKTMSLEAMMPGRGVERILVTPTDYRRLWSAINISDKGARAIAQAAPSAHSIGQEDFAEELDNHISPYLVAVYEAILLDAVSEKASDIHIERYHQRVRVRLRVDGELFDLSHYQLTPAEMAGVINVIKTRAELNIAERRLPQGGRSRLKVGQITYDLRIQTQPSLHGEHVVIRLLPQSGRAMGLDELGLSSRIASQYRRLLDNPAGLVLIVGPTGSGKSTTLSAGLQELADDGRRKVITVEDPIEYAIDNIQQTRVRTKIGFGFADAMRSFVRQDPDVILVGEIRDSETALEAVRASQTGHLVLSTLHCNDAVDAIQRLYDLGLHRNSIASELLAVIAQRLAKRICTHCREPAKPDPKILHELFPDEVPDNFRCFVGKGCDQCGQRGTRGRVSVVEYMQVNADFRDIISRQPPLGELRWRALDAGLVTMRDSAVDLVVQGVIPMSELPRILPAERMAPEVRGGVREQ